VIDLVLVAKTFSWVGEFFLTSVNWRARYVEGRSFSSIDSASSASADKAASKKSDRDQFVPIALFSGLGLLVSLIAVCSAWPASGPDAFRFTEVMPNRRRVATAAALLSRPREGGSRPARLSPEPWSRWSRSHLDTVANEVRHCDAMKPKTQRR